MSDDKTDNTAGAVSDLELARMVRDLYDEIQPNRDLWQGIQRKILDAPQPKIRSTQGWMPYGVAASLVIATAALVLNLLPVTGGKSVFMEPVGYDQIEGEYMAVRNPMIEKFDRMSRGLEESTRMDLMNNLDILNRARKDLEQELRLDPGNQRAREMLIRVNEQELALLKQDYLAPARSLRPQFAM